MSTVIVLVLLHSGQPFGLPCIFYATPQEFIMYYIYLHFMWKQEKVMKVARSHPARQK